MVSGSQWGISIFCWQAQGWTCSVPFHNDSFINCIVSQAQTPRGDAASWDCVVSNRNPVWNGSSWRKEGRISVTFGHDFQRTLGRKSCMCLICIDTHGGGFLTLTLMHIRVSIRGVGIKSFYSLETCSDKNRSVNSRPRVKNKLYPLRLYKFISTLLKVAQIIALKRGYILEGLSR